jgi:tRNA/tmRNA/rRNA uracil-C5-methylase (TrmA/RlmC/RlmD family)
MSPWGSPEEIERRRRIRVSVWAYAYELLDVSLVSDEQFDRECRLVDPKVSTGHRRLDEFFRKHFADYTGQWVRLHPDQARLAALTRAVIDGFNPKG